MPGLLTLYSLQIQGGKLLPNQGVYKQWTGVTGLLEWWNTGMVDWVIFVLAFIIYHTISTS